MTDLPFYLQSPCAEWALVFILAVLAIAAFQLWNRIMFQQIIDQITRLGTVIVNLGVHITAITQERDALKVQVVSLQAQIAELEKGAPDIEALAASLKAQVDAAAALFPEG